MLDNLAITWAIEDSPAIAAAAPQSTTPANPTGSQADIVSRLQALLPVGWFGDWSNAPVISALLVGMANALAWVYSLIAYLRLQTRIATATDLNLDLVGSDFFGNALPRQPQEADNAYRLRIQGNLMRERGDRPGMVKILQQITGNPPVILEPWRSADFGGYGAAYGYGAGAYGFSNAGTLQYQAFIQVQRAKAPGGPPGYGCPQAGYTTTGAYAASSIQFDATIYAAVEAVRPIATVDWVQIYS
ncbi:MAG: hypothetical protein JO142_02290 [Burkholderiales bacterium]|nr:hypothetical protein [Burkholderiales bacterium]